MNPQDVKEISVEGMIGQIRCSWSFLGLEGTGLLKSGKSISAGRNSVQCIDVTRGASSVRLAVKWFGRRSFVRDRPDRRGGSRARRTFETALMMRQRGVGTPEPVCYLERWKGPVLLESCYVSVYEEAHVSFRDELIRLFAEDPECERFMRLMGVVAEAVSGMHRAGIVHRDLGNQNILLRRVNNDWNDVLFIDLNRARVYDSLCSREMARDISRVYLPSDLLRVFVEMYFGGTVPPLSFIRWHKYFRWLFSLHTRTRKWRHPLREWMVKRKKKGESAYPEEKDMWIWDSRSSQPISVMRPRDRRKWYPASRSRHLLVSSARHYRGVKREYEQLVTQAFLQPVNMRNRIGLALGFESGNDEKELGLLEELEKIPVLVRFCAHQEALWEIRAAQVDSLSKGGHQVGIALLQDTVTAESREKWSNFARKVASLVGPRIEFVEIGHAVNRVKWGIWDLSSYSHMAKSAFEAFAGTGARLVGPAAIDFELPFVAAVLDQMPDGLVLDGLSHHLYVDRRGAPETKQSGFSTLEKGALLKAIARTSGRTKDSVIVSEVNWPIAGTGVWSPVNSPYISPGPRANDPSVSEEAYACYMTRYLLTCICSGMVDQVFWWRLVARGFGLVDDTDQAWRKRPSFLAFQQLIKMLNSATFRERSSVGTGGTCLAFEEPGRSAFDVIYNHITTETIDVPGRYARIFDSFGREIDCRGRLDISGAPVYCRRL